MLKRLGAIAVPAFIVAIAILAMTLPYRHLVVFEPPFLALILSLTFRFGVSMIVAYISARSYLTSGSPSLLFLGSGVLAFGSSGLAGSAAGYLIGGSNDLVTISNTGALVASILHVAGTAFVLAGTASRLLRLRRLTVILAYLGVLALMVLLTIASLKGGIPAFLLKGSSTLLNYGVTGSATALFAFSSIFLMKVYTKSKSNVIFWYSLALAFIAVSQSSFFISPAPGSAISWLGRSATCLGGVYFLISVLTAGRGARTKGRQS